MTYAIDHLVLGCHALKHGAQALQQAHQLALVDGGQHLHMGTHNRLLNLGDGQHLGAYLELIAIDPALPAPNAARWFGLDAPAVAAQLTSAPRPLAWVVRVSTPQALDDLHAAHPDWVGPPQTQSRGDLSWRIAVPTPDATSDTRRLGGAVPVFIAWPREPHPSQRLPGSPWRLHRLTCTHPQPHLVRAVLDTLGVAHLIEIDAGPRIELRFQLRCADALQDATPLTLQ